jgi:hypothetical protein
MSNYGKIMGRSWEDHGKTANNIMGILDNHENLMGGVDKKNLSKNGYLIGMSWE